MNISLSANHGVKTPCGSSLDGPQLLTVRIHVLFNARKMNFTIQKTTAGRKEKNMMAAPLQDFFSSTSISPDSLPTVPRVSPTRNAIHLRVDNEDPHRTLEKFKQLLIHNREISHLVFAPVLKACSKASLLEPGMQIHAQTIKRDLSSDVFIQTSLVSMYSSPCGQLQVAFRVFEKMAERNVVSWTAIINACLGSEQPALALEFFREMQKSGVKPDCFTLVSVLSACAHLGALNLGRWVHAYIQRTGLALTVFTGTALVDMYCKCGNVDDARAVFHSMEKKNVHSWNAMLYGLSVHGQGLEAIRLFAEMETHKVHPNEVTFLAVLCGCSHRGLVQEGWHYFDMMQSKYSIKPTIKHYGGMIDLLGRAGLLDEAFKMTKEMPLEPNIVVWGALLSACRDQNNISMAQKVSEMIGRRHGDGLQGDTSQHVIMSNIYAQAGLTEKMAEERMKIGKKPTGRSCIEIGCEVHEFAVGDASHPMWGKIEEMLVEVRKLGKEREEELQNTHSEKIAVAFGLLSTSAPTTIRIVKNLRICRDCHSIMKSISEVYGRNIIVRDCTRFHQFRRGLCTCNEFW